MDIKASSSDLSPAGTLILFHFEGSDIAPTLQTLHEPAATAAQAIVDAGDFSGKAEQIAVGYVREGDAVGRVILAGLGSTDQFSAEAARRAAAQAVKKARELKAETVTAQLFNALETAEASEALTEGTLLGLYEYQGQKTGAASDDLPAELTIHVNDDQLTAANAGIEAGKAIASAVHLTRDLVNLPPNICTPAHLAQTAREVGAAAGLKVDVLGRKQMEALSMGALLGVAQGTDTPPHFIIMEHNAAKASELDTIVLVGKAVTFDTGGYSLKTRDGMVGMKADMAGGGAVIGAMQAISRLNVPLHVVGLIPATDNMVSGKAYRPQDVLKASNGVTIEIISTDAEGRLLLADALVFASRYQPAAVIDIATLTGSCITALGTVAAGLFSNNDSLRDSLLAASSRTGERIWPLPLLPEYNKPIESQTADIKNSAGGQGGASIAAAFLEHFVDYPAWAHLDIAGMAGIDGVSRLYESAYIPAKGATGFGARLMTDFVRNWQPG